MASAAQNVGEATQAAGEAAGYANEAGYFLEQVQALVDAHNGPLGLDEWLAAQTYPADATDCGGHVSEPIDVGGGLMRVWAGHQCHKRLRLDMDFDQKFTFVESADADRRRCKV